MRKALQGLQIFSALVFSLSAFASLPADNPYAPAYAALARLTPADRDAINSGKPASPAAAPLLAEITRSLAAGRQAASVDWGVDYEHMDWSGSYYASEAIRIARLGLADIENSSPSAIADRAIDTLTLARHVGRDGGLLSYLVQRGIESSTEKLLRKHFAQFSPLDAKRLVEAMGKLPPGGDLATALTVQKTVFNDRLANEIRSLVETLGNTDSPTENFASRLRLAGIITDGRTTSVGLEQETDSFWLKPGENKHGITLLSVNLTKDEALLACNGQIARLKLSVRKFMMVDFSHLADAIKSLPKYSILRMIMEHEGLADGEDTIRMLEQATHEIGDIYTEAIAHPENFADNTANQSRIKKLTRFAQNAVDPLPRIIENEKKSQERQAKLLADLSAIAAGPVQP